MAKKENDNNGCYSIIRCLKINYNERNIWLSKNRSHVGFSDNVVNSRWQLRPHNKINGAYFLEFIKDNDQGTILQIEPNSNQIIFGPISENFTNDALWFIREHENGSLIESVLHKDLILVGNPRENNITLFFVGEKIEINRFKNIGKNETLPDGAIWNLLNIEKDWISIDIPILAHIPDFRVIVPSGVDAGYKIFTKPTLLKQFLDQEMQLWHKYVTGDSHHRYVLPRLENGIKNAMDALERLKSQCVIDNIGYKEAYKQLLDATSQEKLPVTSCTLIGKHYFELCEQGEIEKACGYLGGYIGVSNNPEIRAKFLEGMHIAFLEKNGFYSEPDKNNARVNEVAYTLSLDVKSGIINLISRTHRVRKNLLHFYKQQCEKLHEEGEKFDKIINERKAKLDNLEELYQTKLGLQSPVQYWEGFAQIKKRHGAYWFSAFILLLCGTIFGITSLVIWVPDGLNCATITPTFVRMSLLILSVFALLVYGMRAFLKLAMSNFHLMSDALERSKLTESYLAIIEKDPNAIPDAQREIILQSLFGRSDTGLLKDDGHPIMPIISNLKSIGPQ